MFSFSDNKQVQYCSDASFQNGTHPCHSKMSFGGPFKAIDGQGKSRILKDTRNQILLALVIYIFAISLHGCR